MDNGLIVNNMQLVEIIVPPSSATATRIQLLDQPYLRNAFTWGLETFTVVDVPTSPQGNAVVTAAQLGSAFLTLYVNDSTPGQTDSLGEYINQQPMTVLHNLQNASTNAFERAKYKMSGQRIQWDKSYITLGTALGNTGANVSFLLNVNFTFDPKNPR